MEIDIEINNLFAALSSHNFPDSYSWDSQGSDMQSHIQFYDDVSAVQRPTTSIARARDVHKSEWDELKPLLCQLYLVDGLTLKAVQAHLRETRSLVVTKKQLTSRFLQWNFRKNSKAGVKPLLHKICLHSEQRFGGPVCETPSEVQMPLHKEKHLAQNRNYQKMVKPDTCNNQDPLHHTSSHESTIRLPTAQTSFFPREATSGSPQSPDAILTRLFKVLHLEEIATTHDPTLQSAHLLPEHSASELTIQGRKYTSLYYFPSNSVSPFDEDLLKDTAFIDPVNLALSSFMHSDPRFGQSLMNVLYPSKMGMSPNTNLELYPFPSASTSQKKSDNILHAIFQAIYPGLPEFPKESHAKECFRNLSKLQARLRENHTAILREMLRAAYLSHQLKDYAQAECYSRSIISVKLLDETSMDPNLPPLLARARLLLSWMLIHQERHSEASQVLENVDQWIFSSDASHRDLKDFALLCAATLSHYHGNYTHGYNLYRQLFQSWVDRYGLRHKMTIDALRCLADLMNHERMFSDVNQLIQIIADMENSNSSVPNRDRMDTGRRLARVRARLGLHQEAETIYRRCYEQSVKLLGRAHPMLAQVHYGLAKAYWYQGRFQESLATMRENVEGRLRAGKSSVLDARPYTWFGFLLHTSGQHEEAGVWLKMAHNIYLDVLGLRDPSTVYTEYMVARCYSRQSRDTGGLSSFGGGVADGLECDAECCARFEEWREQFGRAAVTCCYAKLPWKPVL